VPDGGDPDDGNTSPGGQEGSTLTWSNGTGAFYDGNNETKLTISRLPDGPYMLKFTLNISGSWDGDQAQYGGATVGTDRWSLRHNGADLVNDTFTNFADIGFTQSYPGGGTQLN